MNCAASIPKPKDSEEQADGKEESGDPALPQTLVRIPIQQAEAAQREKELNNAAGGG
jgi:DASH complex subunit DAD2